MPRLIEVEVTMRFSVLARECLAALSSKRYPATTTERYDYVYGAFRAHLLAIGRPDSVESFDDDALKSFVDAREAAGIHPNSIRLELSALSRLAKYAMTLKDGRRRPLMLHNPTQTFGDRPMHQRPDTKFLFIEEQAAFLGAQARPHEDFARWILFETGLRVSELIRADVVDMVQSGGRWYLGVTVKGRGRAEERLHVPLSAELGELWESWARTRRGLTPATPLLVSAHGRRWTRNGFTAFVKRLAKRAGLRRLTPTAHTLRHTANVNARLAGEDAVTRSRLLHHASMKTLERYEHVVPMELEEARDRINAFVRSRLPVIQPHPLNPPDSHSREVQREGEN